MLVAHKKDRDSGCLALICNYYILLHPDISVEKLDVVNDLFFNYRPQTKFAAE